MLRPLVVLTASAFLPITAAQAATADLLQDLSLNVTATATDRGDLSFRGSGGGPNLEVIDQDTDEQVATATGFAMLPLSVEASESAVPDRFKDGDPPRSGARVLLDADRSNNKLTIQTELSTVETRVFSGGDQALAIGTAAIDFSYQFRLVEEAFVTLSMESIDVSFDDARRTRNNPFFAPRVIRSSDGEQVFKVFPSFVEDDFESQTLDSGVLASGDYELLYQYSIESGDEQEVVELYDIELTVSALPSVVPSPAAASAGLALLAGVAGRRRRSSSVDRPSQLDG